jgi:GT2 family glycosyltransferase
MQENSNYVLSIIVVNWNAAAITEDCLNSIVSNKYYLENPGKIELILVDNNSIDDSVRKLTEKFSDIDFILNKENLGYAIACNQGMKTAKGKYCLLLGNDTILKENALSGCIDYLENNSDCGAVGCRLVYPDGGLQGNCKRFPKFKNGFFTYLSLHKYNFDYDMLWFDYAKTMEVDQIATTFLMIRNELARKIGFFDEQYRIMYNDVDLCRKIWDSGYKIVFLHDIEIIHHGSHSTKRADYKIRKIMYKDIIRFYRNNFGIAAYVMYPIMFVRLFIITYFLK